MGFDTIEIDLVSKKGWRKKNKKFRNIFAI